MDCPWRAGPCFEASVRLAWRRIRGRRENVCELSLEDGLVAILRCVDEDVAAILFDPVLSRAVGPQVIADPMDRRVPQVLA